MTEKEFLSWCEEHCLRFGLQPEKAMRTLALWGDVFRAGSYSLAELRAASRTVAGQAVGPWLDRHLPALLGAIKEARAVTLQREANEAAARSGTCATCSGTGRVIVPNPGGIRDGEWVPIRVGKLCCYYTAAVWCSCGLGAYMANRQATAIAELPEARRREKRLMMTLPTYEMANPHWRAHMTQRSQEQTAVAGVRRRQSA